MKKVLILALGFLAMRTIAQEQPPTTDIEGGIQQAFKDALETRQYKNARKTFTKSLKNYVKTYYKQAAMKMDAEQKKSFSELGQAVLKAINLKKEMYEKMTKPEVDFQGKFNLEKEYKDKISAELTGKIGPATYRILNALEVPPFVQGSPTIPSSVKPEAREEVLYWMASYSDIVKEVVDLFE